MFLIIRAMKYEIELNKMRDRNVKFTAASLHYRTQTPTYIEKKSRKYSEANVTTILISCKKI